jgi:serine/threonine-protein kinase
MPVLHPGATFAGHRIEGIAGRGGKGTVYRATHLALDHVVALKVISPGLAADDAFRERFRSESRIAVSLRHPNVVPIHHAGEEDGLLFVTMDLVDGPDLRGMLIAGGTLPPDRAIAIVEQVASALDVAHSRGLVHRDIKPGNILVERDSGDRAYLTDFGLAKRFDQGTDAGALTRTGAFVGTLDYVAPEQIRGDRVDARTDVYALGCVMYEAIAGKAPFADREENVAKIYAHLQDEPPWLPGEGGNGGSLDEVIARALAKEPADRYPSAGDLARAAAAAIEGEEVLRSAERSVATGKAAPETGEPAAPPIEDTASSEVVTEPGPEPAGAPEPEPAATEPFAVAAATTAAHPGPTLLTEAESGSEPPGRRPPSPRAEPPERGGGGGPRWGRLAAAGAAVAALVVVAVLALGGGGDDHTTGAGGDGATAAAGSDGSAEPKTVGDPIRVAELPVGIATGGGWVGVASRSGAALTMIDQETGKTDGSPVGLPGEGEDVAIAAGAAWVTVPDQSQVVKVPLAGGDSQPIDVGSPPYGITTDGSSVWVAQPEAQQITAIDPSSADISDQITIDGSTSPSEIASGDGRLWVVDRDGGELFSLDPSDPASLDSQMVGGNPKGVVVAGDGSVWVAKTDDGTVDHFDTDGTRLGSVKVGKKPRLLAAGFGRIWVANGGGYVSAIDPADDDSVINVKTSAGSPEGVAVGDDEVWVTTGLDGDSVVRIDPDPAG